jgi:hypothetical protein
MTCGDCIHWDRCHFLISSLTGAETACDWTPSRFWARTPPPSPLWPDDPEEERAHGPTREEYRFGWKP